MPVFVWEGRVGEQIEKGEMEAPNKSAVLARLRQMQIQPIPTKIKPSLNCFWVSQPPSDDHNTQQSLHF